jgi:hypothetical protein
VIATHSAPPGTDPSSISFAGKSFRDPAGCVFRHDSRILRAVAPAFAADFQQFLSTKVARAALEAGTLVRSTRISRVEAAQLGIEDCGIPDAWFYEHEPIPFPSYPYEWPAEMLHAAAELTLDLGIAALEEGFGLKDGTPYNVLFRGSRPVFVDVLSFEKRDPLSSVWLAYAQFARTFLLPLLASRTFGLPPHQALAAHRDGLEPETVLRWAGVLRRFSPGFFKLVTLPATLASKRNPETYRPMYQPRRARSADQAAFILQGLLRSCRRQVHRLAPNEPRDSVWTGYLDHKSLYTSEQLEQKERFVEHALSVVRPSTVLDVGANEGHFSLMAAIAGAQTVSIDFDPAVVGSIWRKASAAKLDVLPLVVDLARPTPAMGWRNQECPSFLERAKGHFDLVMMLAVIHHLLVTERIPLEEVLELAAEMSRGFVLIEFVEPSDPMFQRIARGRDALYAHLSREMFEAAAQRVFKMVACERVRGLNRWLYLFRRS